MLEEKLEQLSQLKRQLQKQQKVMNELESQRMSPNTTTAFNKNHLTGVLSGQDQACPFILVNG